MKHLLLALLAFLILIYSAQAQNDSIPDPYLKHNELKLNAIFLIAGAFEIAYERNLNESSSVGISALLPFDDDININYYVSPYYRIFFGKKYAAGFFVEGFGMLNSITDDELSFLSVGDDMVLRSREREYTDFALGVGLGGKWVTKRGILFELSGGIGRNLFNNDENRDDSYEIVGKFSFSIGYRF